MIENCIMNENGNNMNPINAHLPPCYRSSLLAEQNRLEQELLVLLERLDPDNVPPTSVKWDSNPDEAEEDRQRGYTWNIATTCSRLETLHSMKYRLSPQSRRLVLSRLWSLTMRELDDGYKHAVLPARYRLKLLRCLCVELKKISEANEPPSDLVLPWRPIWDALHRLILRDDSVEILVPEASSLLETSLKDSFVDLCYAARSFYPLGAAEEMYAEVRTLHNEYSRYIFYFWMSLTFFFLPLLFTRSYR